MLVPSDEPLALKPANDDAGCNANVLRKGDDGLVGLKVVKLRVEPTRYQSVTVWVTVSA
jgi:hypothetical protein